MSRCLIISGGPLDLEFAAGFIKRRSYDYIVAVDAGVDSCMRLGIRPDIAVGDFDTFGQKEILAFGEKSGLQTKTSCPEKDESDTELAFRLVIEAGYHEADILGATGGRLDHELSNFHLLLQAKKRGLSANYYDAKNRVRLLDAAVEPENVFSRDKLYGKYVSFLPLTEKVRGITLTGFRYPLIKKDISILENPSLCVSNELVAERAVMTFEEGVLFCIESHD